MGAGAEVVQRLANDHTDVDPLTPIDARNRLQHRVLEGDHRPAPWWPRGQGIRPGGEILDVGGMVCSRQPFGWHKLEDFCQQPLAHERRELLRGRRDRRGKRCERVLAERYGRDEKASMLGQVCWNNSAAP